MFGIFKKKPSLSLNEQQKSILETSANILGLTLMMCRSTSGYHQKLMSTKIRGYLVGFFDASLYCAGVRPKSGGQFFLAMFYAHRLLLEQDLGKSVADYVLESIRLERVDPDFVKYQKIGGNEYISFYRGEISSPMTIVAYFRGLDDRL